MSFPSVYTYNFCPNPSFETGISGVSPILGTTVSQDLGVAYSGSSSLEVQTPGNATGEGVTLPPGSILGTATGAVQFQIQGATPTSSGSLNVSAVDLTTSAVLGTTTVSYSPAVSWQLVEITGLSLVSGHNLAVLVETSSPQATAFNIDCVQYEPSTSVNGGVLPTPYIDGDQVFGFWVGTAESSASYKLYQNQITASGNIYATQLAAAFLQSGLAVPLVFSNPALGPVVISGGIDASGMAFPSVQTVQPGTWGAAPVTVSGFGLVVQSGITTVLLASGLTSFGAWVTGIDPAVSFIGPNAILNSGTDTMGSAGYTRPYSTFYAPRSFAVGGVNVWNTARYFAMGFQFASLTNNDAQNISKAQAEIAPLTQSGPSAYTRARSLATIVSPTSQNMVANAAFEVSTTGWTAFNSTITRDTTAGNSPNVIAGAADPTAASLEVTGTSGNFGAYTTISGLIVGQTYTISGYVWPYAVSPGASQVNDIQIVLGPTNFSGPYTSSASVSANTTGAGPAVPLPSWVSGVQQWYRPALTFTAQESNVNIGFWGIPVTGATGTWRYQVGCVMCSPGDNAVPYGDGYSDGWNWQTGGTPGNSPSYFYDRIIVASQAVTQVLTQHIPLGQTAQQPVYYEPVTQYS